MVCVPEPPGSLLQDPKGLFVVNKIRGCCGRRSFVTLSSGQVGIVPESTRKDNMAVLLHGYTNPLVLRPITGQCHKYQIVGDCFVDSIMSGELVLGRLPETC
jgi:hypothetical protein